MNHWVLTNVSSTACSVCNVCSWHVLTSTVGNLLQKNNPRWFHFFSLEIGIINWRNALLHTNNSALLSFRKMTASLPPNMEFTENATTQLRLFQTDHAMAWNCCSELINSADFLLELCLNQGNCTGITTGNPSKFGTCLWLNSTHMHCKRSKD